LKWEKGSIATQGDMFKAFVKKIAMAVGWVIAFPGIILFKMTKSRELFGSFGEIYSLIPSRMGVYVRACYYHRIMKKCPLDINLLYLSKITKPNTEIGHGVLIGSYCTIGLAKIGDNCAIGSRSTLLSGRRHHNFDDPKRPILADTSAPVKIFVGDNTFIGEGSIIMADVGECCIIGAGSVVVKTIEGYSVAVGNPARVIKKRK